VEERTAEEAEVVSEVEETVGEAGAQAEGSQEVHQEKHGLRDPVVHLVVDHQAVGIERPEEEAVRLAVREQMGLPLPRLVSLLRLVTR